MKLFMAALATETNTFSSFESNRASFTGCEYFRGDGSRQAARFSNIPLIAWREAATRDGHDLAESVCAFAVPAGSTDRVAYEGMRDEILDDLKAALPVDAVILFLHGAMVAVEYDDCEGDVISRVRAVVGPGVPIGVEIDLHCHLTDAMTAGSDVIVVFKEYPHTDMVERAGEVYRLTMRAVRHEIEPVMAVHDCLMIGVWRPSTEPMRGFVEAMKAAEGEPGILSVSLAHGFPWADVAEVGSRMLVVTDGDADLAKATAASFAERLWSIRHEAAQTYDTVDEAIDKIMTGGSGLLVLADVADNAGAGATADNTDILRRLVDRRATDVAIGLIWDPEAVAACADAGVGESLRIAIGGKTDRSSGQPVDLDVEVMAIARDHWQTGLSGGRMEVGTGVWVRSAGIDIVLTSKRSQTHSPEAFTGLGLSLDDKRAVVVKSMQHFVTAFAPIAREIRYVAAGGAATPDFAALPYTKRTDPFWPAVEDPFLARDAGDDRLEVGR